MKIYQLQWNSKIQQLKSISCGFRKGGVMRRYRVIVAAWAMMGIMAGFHLRNAFPELIPILFLMILIPQLVLMLIRLHDVADHWRKFEEAVTEEVCEKVAFVANVDEKLPLLPFVRTLRVLSVICGINPDRAGPVFGFY